MERKSSRTSQNVSAVQVARIFWRTSCCGSSRTHAGDAWTVWARALDWCQKSPKTVLFCLTDMQTQMLHTDAAPYVVCVVVIYSRGWHEALANQCRARGKPERSTLRQNPLAVLLQHVSFTALTQPQVVVWFIVPCRKMPRAAYFFPCLVLQSLEKWIRVGKSEKKHLTRLRAANNNLETLLEGVSGSGPHSVGGGRRRVRMTAEKHKRQRLREEEMIMLLGFYHWKEDVRQI